MSLSVIVPAYNAATTIERCLKSLREALPHDAEIIVVDDGSSDGTAAVAAKVANRVLSEVKNAGPAAARWRGARETAGDILLFVDADVVVPPGALSTLEKFFLDNPSIDAITGLLSAESMDRNFWSRYKNLYMNFTFLRTPEDAAFLYGSIFAIRSKIRGLMPPAGRIAEDTAFGQALVRAGKSIRLLKSLEVKHLRRYTFLSFIRNDFRIPCNWGRLLVGSGGWRHVGRRGSGFAHASWLQIASLALAPLTLLCGIHVAVGLTAGSLWLIVNLPFLSFLTRKRGALFGLLSVPATFFDHLVMASGAATGMFTGFLKPA